MKHWNQWNVATRKIFVSPGTFTHSGSRSYPPLPFEGERIEVRGFGIAACSDANAHRPSPLRRERRTELMPLQSLASTD